MGINHFVGVVLQTPAKPSLADTLMAAAGRLSPFQDEADLRAAPEDLSSASDSGSQTHGLTNGTHVTFSWQCLPLPRDSTALANVL